MTINYELITLGLVAAINLYTAYYSRKTQDIALETKAIAEKTEVNTNSMREQLVEEKGKAEHARGKEEARSEAEKVASALLGAKEPVVVIAKDIVKK